jgi:sulfite exporter TauE/SafE
VELLTAFMLGFAGSLHCAGMCGPIVLAMPAVGRTAFSQVAGRLAYNGGRLVTYGLLGVLFGAFGQLLGMLGVQRWVSIAAGAVILLGVFAWPLRGGGSWIGRPVAGLKQALGRLLNRRTVASQLLFGGLNGLLPCGLVYVACAAATATGSLVGGLQYMLVFGLGTVPMMFGLSLAGRFLHVHLRGRVQRVIPVALGLMGLLLILRGMSLGIPFLSPDLAAAEAGGCCCH